MVLRDGLADAEEAFIYTYTYIPIHIYMYLHIFTHTQTHTYITPFKSFSQDWQADAEQALVAAAADIEACVLRSLKYT